MRNAAVKTTPPQDGNEGAPLRDRSPGEYIEGFSSRFLDFLDVIGFPSSGRYTYGAAICSVSVNGFRRWCLLDVAPRTFTKLEESIDLLLSYTGIPGHPTKKIMAWLYFGDEKDNPFPEIIKQPEALAAQNADPQGFWACLYCYAKTTHGSNINLLADRHRSALMRDVKAMAADRFGIRLTASNFNEMASTEGMSQFREKLDAAINIALAR